MSPIPTIDLEVRRALPQDVGQMRVRIDSRARLELEATVGDIVELRGRSVTAAAVWKLPPDEEGRGIIRVSEAVRRNAGVDLGQSVEIRKASVSPANRIEVRPTDERWLGHIPTGFETVLRRAYLRRPFTLGDVHAFAGSRLLGSLGRRMGDSPLRFEVVSVHPKGVVLVTERTQLVMHGPSEEE